MKIETFLHDLGEENHTDPHIHSGVLAIQKLG